MSLRNEPPEPSTTREPPMPSRTIPLRFHRRALAVLIATGIAFGVSGAASRLTAAEPRRLLYVAEPGIRNYLEYGGHGLLVFDIDHGHKFLKRIKTAGIDPKTGKPENVKGVCASARTG